MFWIEGDRFLNSFDILDASSHFQQSNQECFGNIWQSEARFRR